MGENVGVEAGIIVALIGMGIEVHPGRGGPRVGDLGPGSRGPDPRIQGRTCYSLYLSCVAARSLRGLADWEFPGGKMWWGTNSCEEGLAQCRRRSRQGIRPAWPGHSPYDFWNW